MSSAPSSRSMRRRILAVGDAQIAGILEDGPQLVENIFEALGEVAVAPASSPIDAIVLPLNEGMDAADLVRAAESIRRLDPTVQIVAVVSDPPVPEIQPHVDFQVGGPITPKGLEDLLDGRLSPGVSAMASDETP